MQVRVLIFGTLFLFGNVAYALHEVQPQNLNFAKEESQKRLRKNAREEVQERLIARGIEAEAAATLVAPIDTLDEMLLQNLLGALHTVSYDMLIDTLATRVLFGQNTDMTRYDTLVAIARTFNPYLESSVLEKLHGVARSNALLADA